MTSAVRISPPVCAAAVLALLAAQAAILLALGRMPICTCGTVKLWVGAVQSAENSQHIFDWYSLTHVIHGMAAYLMLWWLLPRTTIWFRLVLAVAIEGAWEVLENTPFIIERYRAGTISLGYYGDSVVNSLADCVSMMAKFMLAHRLPVWLVIGLAVLIEAGLLYSIRDSLMLNILMLIHPFDAVRQWQAGG